MKVTLPAFINGSKQHPCLPWRVVTNVLVSVAVLYQALEVIND